MITKNSCITVKITVNDCTFKLKMAAPALALKIR